MLIGNKISKSFGNIDVLKEVNIEIKKGELISIIGESGSGKTTLLNILGTIENPDSGTVSVNKINVNTLREAAIAELRNKKIGFVFQAHHLLPEFTALENVCLPGFINKENQKIEKKGIEILNKLNLKNRLHHKPHQLSGGEQQRVSLARALINNPDVILADEPTGNLDVQNSNVIFDLIVDMNKEHDLACLFVTHNIKYSKLASKRYSLKQGKLSMLT